jgi:hypothetical protein
MHCNSTLRSVSFLTRRPPVALAVLLGTLLLHSCSPDNGGGVPVSGNVKFNGEPLEKGAVTFVNDKLVPVAMGFIEKGHYALEQSVSYSGIPPGPYKVYINSWIEEPGERLPNGGMSEGISRLPSKYQSVETSGFTADVAQSGGTFDFTMEGQPDPPKKRR